MFNAEKEEILRLRISKLEIKKRKEEIKDWYEKELSNLLFHNEFTDSSKDGILYIINIAERKEKKKTNPSNSAIAYVLGVTDIKPQKQIKYSGGSLPDLDLDFDPRGRKDVMQYVYQKYGQEKCAQIGTYSVFKPKGSLRDFARVCGYDPIVGTKLAELVPPSVAGKTLSFDEVIKAEPKILKTEYPQVVDLARKSEGMRNKVGVHAAGLVISNDDLSTQLPIFLGKGKEVATQFDMHDVEEIGLVKYDFLGLKTLTVIQDTIKLIKKNRSKDININLIDTEDQEVYKNIFQTGRLEGVFQFENSSGFKDLCIKVRPESIEDLSAITALFRPGPLGMKDADGKSMVDQYIDGKNGKSIVYLVPELEPILKNTYSVMTYQEQIMRICTDVAGYTLSEADNMRKIIGKKLPEKMKLEREKFIGGCVSRNIEEDKAKQLFDNIEGFAMYSFNKAHSVAYSLISYRTAWLKNYYPLEFYTSILNNADSNKDQAIKYIHSCKEDGITLLPPDVNISEMAFTISGEAIVFGLSGVKGIAEKGGNDLVEKRKALGRFSSLQELIEANINKSILVALTECGALQEINDFSREQLVENVEAIIDYYKKIKPWEERFTKYNERQKEIEKWELDKQGPKPRKLVEPKNKPEFPRINMQSSITRKDRLRLEHKTLGFYLTGHPLDDYHNLTKMASYNIEQIQNGEVENKGKISIPVVISKVTEIRTRTGKNMANIIVEDRTGRQEATIFPKAWIKLKEKVIEEAVCVIHGFVECYTTDEEDAKSIVSIIITDLNSVEEDLISSIKTLVYKLIDGSEWSFIPGEEQSEKTWQEANTYINNLKRIG
jgi:DNA polymerase-3 subunit alpha